MARRKLEKETNTGPIHKLPKRFVVSERFYAPPINGGTFEPLRSGEPGRPRCNIAARDYYCTGTSVAIVNLGSKKLRLCRACFDNLLDTLNQVEHYLLPLNKEEEEEEEAI